MSWIPSRPDYLVPVEVLISADASGVTFQYKDYRIEGPGPSLETISRCPWQRRRTLALPLRTAGQAYPAAINYLLLEIGHRAGLGRVHPHMLRHACGYALADKGTDFRLMQDYRPQEPPAYSTLHTHQPGALRQDMGLSRRPFHQVALLIGGAAPGADLVETKTCAFPPTAGPN